MLLIKHGFIIIGFHSADTVQFQSKTLAHLRDLLIQVYFASIIQYFASKLQLFGKKKISVMWHVAPANFRDRFVEHRWKSSQSRSITRVIGTNKAFEKKLSRKIEAEATLDEIRYQTLRMTMRQIAINYKLYIILLQMIKAAFRKWNAIDFHLYYRFWNISISFHVSKTRDVRYKKSHDMSSWKFVIQIIVYI